MNVTSIIGVAISTAGFAGGVIVAIAKLAMKTGRLMERLESNEKRDKEEREKIGANLSELYSRMNAAECDIRAQATSINNIEATCSRIETKLDRVIEVRGKHAD